MNTIALQGTSANQPEAKAHRRGKAKVAASSSKLTEKLQQLLDDVENDRFETVDPKNYREGFKELLVRKKKS
jgi:soluble cytochrome b562